MRTEYKFIDGAMYIRAVDIPAWLDKAAIGADIRCNFKAADYLRGCADTWRRWILDKMDKNC